MTTDAGPDDPVNRWATEHYGFEDDKADQGAGLTHPTPHPTSTADAAHTSPTSEVPSRRRRNALVGVGVLAASVIAGFGGVAVAADGPGSGLDGRGAGRISTVRFDHQGGRGGVGGDVDGSLGFEARGVGRE